MELAWQLVISSLTLRMKLQITMRYHHKQPTPYALHLTMPVPTIIAVGFVLPASATNNTLAAGQTATTVSEHIVHALPDYACVVPVMLVMCWLSSSPMIESVQ